VGHGLSAVLLVRHIPLKVNPGCGALRQCISAFVRPCRSRNGDASKIRVYPVAGAARRAREQRRVLPRSYWPSSRRALSALSSKAFLRVPSRGWKTDDELFADYLDKGPCVVFLDGAADGAPQPTPRASVDTWTAAQPERPRAEAIERLTLLCAASAACRLEWRPDD
jgi:hypothetical protein